MKNLAKNKYNSAQSVDICMAFNWPFFTSFRVALYSLSQVESLAGNTLHILHEGFNEVQIEKIRTFVSGIEELLSVNLHNISEFNFDNAKTLRGSSICYARLLLPTLLESSDYCVYVDVDIVFNKGLKSFLIDEDGKALIVAVADSSIGKLDDDCEWVLDAHEKNIPYFNSGILGLNLAELRKIDFTRKSIDLANKDPDKCRFHDQTIMNYMLRGQVKLIPRDNNFMFAIHEVYQDLDVRRGGDNKNIHYVSKYKRWLYFSFFPCCSIWWKNARMCGADKSLELSYFRLFVNTIKFNFVQLVLIPAFKVFR